MFLVRTKRFEMKFQLKKSYAIKNEKFIIFFYSIAYMEYHFFIWAYGKYKTKC